MPIHNMGINFSFNSKGNILASASEDKSIIFWNTETGKSINKLNEHKNYIRQVSFSPDDSRLISCNDDSHVIIWKTGDYKSTKMIDNIIQGSNWILSSCYFNDNKVFASAGVDGKIRVSGGFINNSYKINKIIQKIVFKPNEGYLVKIAVATRGKGVLLVDTSKY